mmetsp:Transcript_58843/g.140517  ORF Transcript_58843/g.140517 Transcript_58843/m.140517 type:complete len:417 (+) Transcript_58843:122-1372(+)
MLIAVRPIETQWLRDRVELGPRPFYLVSGILSGVQGAGPAWEWRQKLYQKFIDCSGEPKRSVRSVAHRGAPLMFPEETEAGLRAAYRMGAGVLECDAVLTNDRQFVCRHGVCDLHYTTDILSRPDLAAKCTAPFSPRGGATPAAAVCCSTDFSLEEFKQLCATMEMEMNTNATSLATFLKVPAGHSEVYAGGRCFPTLSHKEFVSLVNLELFEARMTPELKVWDYQPLLGLMPEEAADLLAEDYADVPETRVFPQSFDPKHVERWLSLDKPFPDAVLLVRSGFEVGSPISKAQVAILDDLQALRPHALSIVAMPFQTLLEIPANVTGGEVAQTPLVATRAANFMKDRGLRIWAWTLERSGPLPTGTFFSSVPGFMQQDSDVMVFLHALFQVAGVEAVFSDWPATVSLYAACIPVAT